MKKTFKLLTLTLPIFVPLITISCYKPVEPNQPNNQTKQDDNNYKKPEDPKKPNRYGDITVTLLDVQQLENIKESFKFTLTNEGRKENLNQLILEVNNLLSKYKIVSNNLNEDLIEKYQLETEQTQKILKDSNFKKLFNLVIPEKLEFWGHPVYIKLIASSKDKNLPALIYTVLCPDQNYAIEAKETIPVDTL
ncbi:hypothetical protein FJO69_01510 [[Mycoplasma] falconis]|uniref:Variable surface lipoprotein n=1 Tax=[Mycoplasma] falconis TaxID=92403 RepID=A0A501XA76_9BACT|nr:hypothetical protein [[Mycoplasma] falconis]TPE57411.1 hypothetical protein FJO69_01510 [[Mycoplasma] falconis]